MPNGFRDYEPGEHTLRANGRYELVYRPIGFSGVLQADPETVRYVVGAKPGTAVDKVDTDFLDNEIHVFIIVENTVPIEKAAPIEMEFVPNDSWKAGGYAIANVLGVSGWAKLDRLRFDSVSLSLSYEQAEAAEQAANKQLDEGGARNFLAKATSDVKKIAGGLGGLALGSLALIVAAQFIPRE